MAGDLVASGATPAEIIRTLKMKPYPAEKLAAQSRNWTPDELDAALDGLLELDVAIKGSDGAVAQRGQVRLLLGRLGRRASCEPQRTDRGRG